MPHPGEIRLFAGNTPPSGWAFCHGHSMSVESAPAVFTAIGSRFGGDGRTTFALPDLCGRVPVHRSDRVALGTEGGVESVILEPQHLPAHQHTVPIGNHAAEADGPGSNAVAAIGFVEPEASANEVVVLGQMVTAGLGNTHPNIQPYLCLNYIIALGQEHQASTHGPFIGEVRLYGGGNAPAGWIPCDGQSVKIGDATTLYTVIGTTYGGDARATFALPDLRGRVAMQSGNRAGLTSRRLGETGGSAITDLTEDQLPSHTHTVELPVSTQRESRGSTSQAIAQPEGGSNHVESAGFTRVSSGYAEGTGQHSNMQPYLSLTYLIAYQGVAPQQV